MNDKQDVAIGLLSQAIAQQLDVAAGLGTARGQGGKALYPALRDALTALIGDPDIAVEPRAETVRDLARPERRLLAVGAFQRAIATLCSAEPDPTVLAHARLEANLVQFHRDFCNHAGIVPVLAGKTGKPAVLTGEVRECV